MKQFIIIFLSATLLLLTSTACRKISTPNEEARELFGSWNYQGNSGGFSGAGGSTKYDPGSWVEFTERGFMKYYEGSKKKFQQRFKIEMRYSIGGQDRPSIVYSNDNYETFIIEDDQLIISDNHYDGYSYSFTKK